jgi:hypothetical protein
MGLLQSVVLNVRNLIERRLTSAVWAEHGSPLLGRCGGCSACRLPFRRVGITVVAYFFATRAYKRMA